MRKLQDYLNYQQQAHCKTIDLGLSRVAKAYKRIFPTGLNFIVITIAGTNGKGSTGAFLSNILKETNISYGHFSSPHLIKYNERFKIDGNYASDDEIILAFKLIEKIQDISLSYFEISTLAALIIFTNKKINIAILEVGLGGRLDSVNIVDANISIITSIDFDHTNYLGNTLKKIATEKAGIMRHNQPCLIPENLSIIKNIIKAKLIKVKPYSGKISLLGNVQKYNAALAKKAAEILHINENYIKHGIKNTTLTARVEKIKIGNKTIILDVAHNPAAVANLATIIEPKTLAIFAALSDKDIKSMIKNITKLIDKWLLVPINNERSLTVVALQKKINKENTLLFDSIKKAIDYALNTNYNNIVIFGSFFIISDALKCNKLNINLSDIN